MTEQQIRHIVRIGSADVNGNKSIGVALTKIKGIKYMYANLVLRIAGIDNAKKAGFLTDAEILKIDDIIQHPQKYNVPNWMLNRRRDYETGEDLHVTGGNVEYYLEQDLRRLKKIKSYRGIRHTIGQPVRGQRTKSNFRRNKGKVVGVKKGAAKEGKA